VPNSNVAIALLCETPELGRHLRDALTSLGTPIVYEAAPANLDVGALEHSGARVVVVNLDPAVEAHLDEVYSLLEDDRYSVVFNDAQASSHLSGWDAARWARHLAAKILGDADIDPPRPEGAESVPVTLKPAPIAVHEEPANDEPDVETLDVAQPRADYDTRLASLVAEDDMPPSATTSAVAPTAQLDSRYEAMARPAESGFPMPAPPPVEGFDFSTLEAATAALPEKEVDATVVATETHVDEASAEEPSPTLDLDRALADAARFSESEDAPAHDEVSTLDVAFDAHAGATDEEANAHDVGEAFDLDALEMLFGDAKPAAPAAMLDDGSSADESAIHTHDDFAGFDIDDTATSVEHERVPLDFEPIDIDSLGLGEATADDVPHADVSDVPAIPKKPSLELSLEDIDDEDENASPKPDVPARAATKSSDAPAAPAPVFAGLSDWSLEDIFEGETPPPPAPPTTGRADFGIEKLSAVDYLAPKTEDVEPVAPPLDDTFSFELMPIEEAVAPQPVESNVNTQESWLDPDKVVAPQKIRRVVVLGASIGGPEAVREFLAEIPRDYPALFLLAQHMGAEFVDLMAQQLAKATPLTVRTPTHGERVGHGEVLIVPTTHRLQIDPEGIAVLEKVASEGAYSPSIDRVIRDIADRYGASATAIVFSGMTDDAVEGAKYLADKGGAVYAQHPDTCVVSTMVDGVVDAGIVKFIGAPKELAETVLADAKKAKR
jgi:chemotaxis response regulator CheB